MILVLVNVFVDLKFMHMLFGLMIFLGLCDYYSNQYTLICINYAYVYVTINPMNWQLYYILYC